MNVLSFNVNLSFRCPLYSDTESLHEQAVLKVAEAAKAEVGVNTKNLKIDPTADIKNYYSEMKKKAAPLPPGVVNVSLSVKFFYQFCMFIGIYSQMKLMCVNKLVKL